MGRKNASSFKLKKVERFEFVKSITDDPADRFAKTFVAKADYQKLWPVLGCWKKSDLTGAIAWTITTREPHTANLQLLHTFAMFRRQGVATILCQEFLNQINKSDTPYWRVSSEKPAVKFYESLGIKFLGVQKSGCLLSVAQTAPTFEECIYSLEDPIISKAINKKGKGGCVQLLGV